MPGLYRAYLRIIGPRFSEVGQPINNFTMLPITTKLVARSGLRITAIDGVGHYLPWPGRPPIELSFLDYPRPFSKWIALHSFIEAVKC